MGKASTSDRVLYVMAAEQEYGPELRRRIAPLIAGVGPVEAAISTAFRLHSLADVGCKPDLVVSLGSAGLGRREVGSVWQIPSVSWRDMDASRLGFEQGVTPIADHPVAVAPPTPVDTIPTASLRTGARVLGTEDHVVLPADLADLETLAVVRASQSFGIPVIGLRDVSHSPGDLHDINGWTATLGVLEGRLAQAVDLIPAALERL